MARKYIYVKFKNDYAGHKAESVERLRGKIPEHMKDHVTEVVESTYSAHARSQKQVESEMIQELGEIVVDDAVPANKFARVKVGNK